MFGSAHVRELIAIIERLDSFVRMPSTVRHLRLSSWCTGASLVRNLAWDALCGYETPSVLSAVDVAYFDHRT